MRRARLVPGAGSVSSRCFTVPQRHPWGGVFVFACFMGSLFPVCAWGSRRGALIAGGLGLVFESVGEVLEFARMCGVSLDQVSQEALEGETSVQAEMVAGVECPEAGVTHLVRGGCSIGAASSRTCHSLRRERDGGLL